MMKILVENVKLRVRIGNSLGKEINTNIGVPQGDCLSPILFILYLAEALKPTQSIATPPYVEDHRYPNFSTNLLMIDQKYADDISWITNKEERKNEIRKQVPPILKEKNLQVNDSKTEEYEIKRGGDENWKKCKYLGRY